jgi:proteic killer suppression protein
MEVFFRDRKLAKLVGSQKELTRAYGSDNGKRIGLRMQNITDAQNLAELARLPHTRVHEFKGDRDEQISVDVKHPYRLILECGHAETPRKDDGGLDWERITNVIVIGIEDTH